MHFEHGVDWKGKCKYIFLQLEMYWKIPQIVFVKGNASDGYIKEGTSCFECKSEIGEMEI